MLHISLYNVLSLQVCVCDMTCSSGWSREAIRSERNIFSLSGLLELDTKPLSLLTQPAKALAIDLVSTLQGRCVKIRSKNRLACGGLWKEKEQDSKLDVVHSSFLEEGDSIIDALFCKPSGT